MSSAQDIRFHHDLEFLRSFAHACEDPIHLSTIAVAILTISIITVAIFPICRGKRPKLFASLPDMTNNTEATTETFFFPFAGSCPLAGLYLTLLSSEISRTVVCLASRRGGQYLDPVEFHFMWTRIFTLIFPYLYFDFASGRHT